MNIHVHALQPDEPAFHCFVEYCNSPRQLLERAFWLRATYTEFESVGHPPVTEA